MKTLVVTAIASLPHFRNVGKKNKIKHAKILGRGACHRLQRHQPSLAL